jgi:hypothetical protein
VDDLVTAYAVAVDDGDWRAYRELFTADGRADYRSAGGIEGDADRIAAWLADSLALFAMRQHLIVNRQVRFGALDHDFAAPDLVCGGRYDFGAVRTPDGWRLSEVVVHEKWRRDGGSGGHRP